MNSHRIIDRINEAEDRLIAKRLQRGPGPLRTARTNLRRWMAADGRKVRPSFVEWDTILTRLSRAEIAEFLNSDTLMARRLRQSSPFAGVLSDAERRRIRRRYEAP